MIYYIIAILIIALIFIQSLSNVFPLVINTSARCNYKFNTSSEFDEHTAGFLSYVSAMAYAPEKLCKQWAHNNGFTELFYYFDSSKVDNTTNTRGFAAQNSDILLITFKGTEVNKIADILADANTFKHTYFGDVGGVHPGFYKALFDAYNVQFANEKVLLDIVKEAVDKDRKIFITGHSLGGALAALFGAYLLDINIISTIYTFGQPRVGNHNFAKNMHNKMGYCVHRIVNKTDTVPNAPPSILDYYHYGNEYYYDINNKLIHSSGVEMPTPIQKVFENNIDIKKIFSKHERPIFDHQIVSGYMPVFVNRLGPIVNGDSNIYFL